MKRGSLAEMRSYENLQANPYNSPMLSYRHAFHAGNHADVLKHLVLVELVDYMRQKGQALWVIDTMPAPASMRSMSAMPPSWPSTKAAFPACGSARRPATGRRRLC